MISACILAFFEGFGREDFGLSDAGGGAGASAECARREREGETLPGVAACVVRGVLCLESLTVTDSRTAESISSFAS